MGNSDDLINFDVIESQKENIQSLPSGRSARKLVELYAPIPLGNGKIIEPTPGDTASIHDCIRAEYEAELADIADLDDPLDVYDRYVRWTLDAYPSAQATPQSQLHLLLERATKAFVGNAQYRNDPRYLKMWLHYIRLFSDAPREAYMYLSRHNIGDALALFYEEYAAWLEAAGRWAQAEEVYRLGVERNARPQQRLERKLREFEQRRAQRAEEEDVDAPASPALPTIRPALAAKTDPFASAAAESSDPQAAQRRAGPSQPGKIKPAKSKLAIFSDADAPAPAMSSVSKGWDSIGSLTERKKENTMEPQPWAGQTLPGKSKMAVFSDSGVGPKPKTKMAVFRDTHQVTAQAGKRQRIVFDLRVLYPTPEIPGSELSFEEVLLARAGWLDERPETPPPPEPAQRITDENSRPVASSSQVDLLSDDISSKLVVHRDIIALDENGAPIKPISRDGRPRKKKVIEVNETQIIKAKLDSPSRPKLLKRKGTSEPTMTMHTRAATDDIYEIFNAPIKPVAEQEEESAEEDPYDTDGDYTSGAESTNTTRNVSVSEAGDEDDEEAEEEDVVDADETSDARSVSEWSDFTARKHIPDLIDLGGEENHTPGGDMDDEPSQQPSPSRGRPSSDAGPDENYNDDEEESSVLDDDEPRTRTTFVPIPPEDYVPERRTYRDPVEMANNRLPFMTPITERTETNLTLGSMTSERAAFSKTPSRRPPGMPIVSDDEEDEDERVSVSDPPSSPLREVAEDEPPPPPPPSKPIIAVFRDEPEPPKKALQPKTAAKAPLKTLPPKGPIINDAQCNPVDESIRAEILSKMHPSLSSQPRFFDHRPAKYDKGSEIRKYAKALTKAKSSGEKTSSLPPPPTIAFPGCEMSYTVKKELGKGAFAPVFLVENSDPDSAEATDENSAAVMGRGQFATPASRRGRLEALKMEAPPSEWEFHMMRLAHDRLGAQHRATASLSAALEMHLYADEGFLFLPLHPHGTLLDVVNLFRAEPSGVMDETLAMFFAVELLRTAEALHAKGILHGDLKADNCLLRLADGDNGAAQQLSGQWRADGSGGWGARGVTLIDFGRGIDVRAFKDGAQFVADWKTGPQDCAEMREGRPWTWQIDYHGLAGTIHCLLFGRYIETVRCDNNSGGGGLGNVVGRRYRVRESLKRYWQTDIWAECFDLLLNPASHVEGEDGGKMPVLRGMRAVRERMETWLEGNCERGVGLKSLMGKVEVWAKGRR